MEKFCLTIKDKYRINEDTWLILFNENLDFEPGQFVMLETPGLTRKPFALGKWKGELAISVKSRGTGSEWIAKKAKKIEGHGPQGKGFARDKSGNGLVIISPTCLSMAASIEENYNADVLVGSRTEFIFETGYETAVGNESFMKALESKMNYDWYLVSGSTEMEKSVWKLLVGKETYFSLEEYMGCGIGACKSCAIQTNSGTKHVCSDGPIFRGDEMCW